MTGLTHFGGGRRLQSLRAPEILIFVAMLSLSALAQSPSGSTAAQSVPPLQRGANEFGVWTGYSPFSFVWKGTTKGRELYLLNLQYARTLLARRALTLKYTADVVPVALEFQPRQLYVIDRKLVVNPGGTVYGAGANPLGVQGNIGNRRIQPFASGSLGFLYFTRQVPVVGSSQFNYNITIGFGTQFFLRSNRSVSVGWKYHHLSNNNQARLNPGIDSGVFYAGFSLVRRKR